MFPGQCSYPLLVAGLHEAYEYHSYKPHEYHIHAGRALWLEFPVEGRKRGVVLDSMRKATWLARTTNSRIRYARNYRCNEPRLDRLAPQAVQLPLIAIIRVRCTSGIRPEFHSCLTTTSVLQGSNTSIRPTYKCDRCRSDLILSVTIPSFLLHDVMVQCGSNIRMGRCPVARVSHVKPAIAFIFDCAMRLRVGGRVVPLHAGRGHGSSIRTGSVQ